MLEGSKPRCANEQHEFDDVIELDYPHRAIVRCSKCGTIVSYTGLTMTSVTVGDNESTNDCIEITLSSVK